MPMHEHFIFDVTAKWPCGLSVKIWLSPRESGYGGLYSKF